MAEVSLHNDETHYFFSTFHHAPTSLSDAAIVNHTTLTHSHHVKISRQMNVKTVPESMHAEVWMVKFGCIHFPVFFVVFLVILNCISPSKQLSTEGLQN